ncbi:hypothetical protein A9R01_16325 ['Osedax' symbiont bacterium Rs2_46_30_T18]|nr:hypothetical protein A9R01_16325 ['Osedax' symbiont bacterium Rs2_46_30_T18]
MSEPQKATSTESITDQSPMVQFMSKLNTRSKLLLGFSVPLTLIIVVCSFVYFNINAYIETSKWVKHTQRVIANGEQLNKLMIDMETGERGFLITGKDEFLEPFNRSVDVWENKLNNLQLLVADNPAQVAKLQSINKLQQRWLTEAAEIEIAKRRQVKSDTASLEYMQKVLRGGVGKKILDEMRVSLDTLQSLFQRSNTLEGANLALAISKDVVDQESGQRGFLIAGEQDFLEPLERGRAAFSLHMGQLRQYVDNNFDTQSVLSQSTSLEKDIQRWVLQIAEPEIALRNEVSLGRKSFADIEFTLIQADGKNILDGIRRDIDTLQTQFTKAKNRKAINILIQIAKNTVDLETGQRGFLITGKKEFLQPFEHAKHSLRILFEDLNNQIQNNYKKAEVLFHIDRIQVLSQQWHNEVAGPQITARTRINRDNLTTEEFLQQTLNRNEGKETLDQARLILQELSGLFSAENDLQGEHYVLQLATSVLDQENAQRGFIVTGDEKYLKPYSDGKQKFENLYIEIMLYVGISESSSTGTELQGQAHKSYQNSQLLNSKLRHLRQLLTHWVQSTADPEISARRRLDNQTENSLSFIQKTLIRATGKDLLDQISAQAEELKDIFAENNVQALLYLQQISKAMVDQETGERGFLITGEERFLEPYVLGQTQLLASFPKLTNIVNDNFNTKDLLGESDVVSELSATWIKLAAEPEIALRRQYNAGEIGFSEIERILSQGVGKGVLDKTRIVLQRMQSKASLAQNHKVLKLLYLLEKDVVDKETGQRGFIVTGRNEFLQPYEDGKKAAVEHMAQLQAAIKANYDKTIVLHKIEQLRLKTLQWDELAAAPEIRLRRNLNASGAKMSDITALIEQGTGKNIIDEIRKILSEFIFVEQGLMATREQQSDKEADNFIIMMIIASLLAVIVAIATSLFVSNSITRKLLSLVSATESLAEGDYDQQIDVNSSDEFAHLAIAFNEMAVTLKHNLDEMGEQNILLSSSEEELKDQSEELKASNEELEEKQQELQASNEDLLEQQRALSLESDKLQKSKVALEEKARELELASKYKSEFLANMSHELRTPLNSLLILSKSLYENKQGNLTTEQVEEADIVYQGGKTLLNLINDIMDLSKVEAGMLDINIDTFLPGELCHNLEALFDPLAKERALEFSINVEQSFKQSISTDRQRLEQILKNFLSNAFKFTGAGKVTLDIYPIQENTESPSDTVDGSLCTHICFKVTDSGIGIPEHKQQAIFEAFQQADGSTSRKYGGTGLGLTISKELALLLGGVISMESQENIGSSFMLTLPANSSEGTAEDNRPSGNVVDARAGVINSKKDHAEAAQLLDTSIQQITENVVWLDDDRFSINKQDSPLLVIEDNKVFCQILINLIRKLDMKVIATDKGREGILLAAEYLPSGILLDLTLPDINGLRVLEQLKDSLQTRHIPVHVISGAEQKMQSLHLGASSYMQKPTDPDVISSTLLQMYENSTDNMKNILVVENDSNCAEQIGQSIAGTETQLSFAQSAEQARTELEQQVFDCIVLDLDLPDLQGTELVKSISAQKGAAGVPIIVYTGRAITEDEYRILNQFSSSIVIKGAESPERLLDDVTLFLHHIGDKYSTAQQQALQMLHDENAMLRDRRVLVVDDDMRNVFAITRILEQAGIQVLQAENGKVAVELLRDSEEPIELILMDIMMPVMDGYEAIAHIRKMSDYQSVPIIALTAKAMPADRQLCIQAGASEYITKPLEMDKVLAMLRVWLYRRMEPEYAK